MSDTFGGAAAPGPFTLIMRAAFVPDGQQPPPEFGGDFSPLKFRATLDTATGIITCDNAGMSFDSDIRAEWHPDVEQGSDDGTQSGGPGGRQRGNWRAG